jgi:flavin reductase (DIM6/NTAB) family NADH-FMN oxidoreductase RutF
MSDIWTPLDCEVCLNKIFSSELDPEQAYKLLTGVVVPRPIAWVTTRNQTGLINLAPFSCFTFVSNKPPMIGINVGRKNGLEKDTGRNIHTSKDFVVNIADDSLVDLVHESAIEFPPEISEVDILGMETIASDRITTPRLAISPISLECRFHSATPFGDTGSEFIVGEILVFHIRADLMEEGKIDTAKLRPLARMGGPVYASIGQHIKKIPVKQTPKSVIK